MGACGTGKSFIANALGNHACENSYTTYYVRLFEFLDDCHQEYLMTESIKKIIHKYAKYDVLILDDFLISSVQEIEAQRIFQLLEYRYEKNNNRMFTVRANRMAYQSGRKYISRFYLGSHYAQRL